MILTFEDTDGRTGTVTDELTVEYDGEWGEQVRERVEDVKERYRTDDDDEVMGEEALSALVRELPEEPRVVEVERRHECRPTARSSIRSSQEASNRRACPAGNCSDRSVRWCSSSTSRGWSSRRWSSPSPPTST